MDIKGDKGFLSPKEEKLSGYINPINILDFDCHAERLAADGELDEIREMMALDPYELPHDVRAELPVRLERAEVRSYISRAIAKERAIRSGIEDILGYGS